MLHEISNIILESLFDRDRNSQVKRDPDVHTIQTGETKIIEDYRFVDYAFHTFLSVKAFIWCGLNLDVMQ